MACVSANDDVVTVSCGLKTYIVCLNDDTLYTINHIDYIKNINSSKIKSKSEGVTHGDNEDLGLGLLSSDISPCGSLLAFVTLSKTLCVINLSDADKSVKACYHLVRGASQVKFTPKSKNVIVTDKSGDVYLFDPDKSEDTGELILGHLSLLLDVLVTPDEKYIITCDRDEKIRVSSFPNAYSIIAYCLGHSEFVSSLILLPHNPNYLISTSGDSTVRFWDYKIGKELLVCNLAQDVKNQTDGVVITNAAAISIDNKTSLLCVCLNHNSMCLVLKCCSVNEQLQYTISQTISVGALSPWRIIIRSSILWLVLNSNNDVVIKAMSFDSITNQFIENVPINIRKAVEIFNSQNLVVDSQSKIIDLLFKQKFDNVKEYLKKKEERLALLEPSLKRCKT